MVLNLSRTHIALHVMIKDSGGNSMKAHYAAARVGRWNESQDHRYEPIDRNPAQCI